MPSGRWGRRGRCPTGPAPASGLPAWQPPAGRSRATVRAARNGLQLSSRSFLRGCSDDVQATSLLLAEYALCHWFGPVRGRRRTGFRPVPAVLGHVSGSRRCAHELLSGLTGIGDTELWQAFRADSEDSGALGACVAESSSTPGLGWREEGTRGEGKSGGGGGGGVELMRAWIGAERTLPAAAGSHAAFSAYPDLSNAKRMHPYRSRLV